MITEIEDFFTKGCGRCPRFATAECSTRKWAAGLADLRRICRAAGLCETVKWGHPCYMHAGRNIAIIGAFRDDFRLSFFNAAVMKDPDGVLERPGPNSAHPSMIRMTDNGRPAALEPVITAYLSEATGHAEAGTRPPKPAGDLALPAELVEALDADPELAEAFHALTPGRRKSYVILVNSARTVPTRLRRVENAREGILAGRGWTDR
ncbi:MAG: YdeI/OmpD-associated family protein [Proteobacteria bacterium]|nr:YdeI/OmpD-associated family protein [Pseudomonadota bacterium]MBS0572416.1 YdeI/OmpD-associated family protein [Pseudomonadota bacterium]